MNPSEQQNEIGWEFLMNWIELNRIKESPEGSLGETPHEPWKRTECKHPKKNLPGLEIESEYFRGTKSNEMELNKIEFYRARSWENYQRRGRLRQEVELFNEKQQSREREISERKFLHKFPLITDRKTDRQRQTEILNMKRISVGSICGRAMQYELYH